MAPPQIDSSGLRMLAPPCVDPSTLAAGGTGRPEGLEKGWYARPTVFANVSNDMTIAREEIFGPVLSIIPYDDEDEAVEIANDNAVTVLPCHRI